MNKKRTAGKNGSGDARELSKQEQALFEAHLDRFPPKTKAADLRKSPIPPSLEKLARRGDVPVDRTLDLHGKTLEAAWLTISAAVEQARAAGSIYLRVITGKGLHSPDGAVLADEIPARLRALPEVAEVVRAVKAKDGGGGAFFVRLRSKP